MTENKLFIPIILGTAREGRESKKVSSYLEKSVTKLTDIETEVIDVKDLDFSGTEGTDLKNQNQGFVEKIEKADGLVIVAPEYNHGIPGSLKMALDILYDEYKHKAVGMVGVSSGIFAGTRAIEHLLHVVKAIGLVPIKPDLHFPQVSKLFDEDGNLLEKRIEQKVEEFISELVWMTKTLKKGRENIS